MQPLTEKQTQRVWSRVMSAQTAPAAAMENPAPAAQAQSETLTPEKLLSLIDGERADSALYAHLAARMKGRCVKWPGRRPATRKSSQPSIF